jgi:hypothetical protein
LQVAPLVSTTLAANFFTIFASVVNTGGKFATCVNERRQFCNLQRRQLENFFIYMLTLLPIVPKGAKRIFQFATGKP